MAALKGKRESRVSMSSSFIEGRCGIDGELGC